MKALSSTSEGLQREIVLRQQQYEYYRDRPLDSPRSGARAAIDS